MGRRKTCRPIAFQIDTTTYGAQGAYGALFLQKKSHHAAGSGQPESA
jgi:hypothetical protein